jgi:hypothetical protein
LQRRSSFVKVVRRTRSICTTRMSMTRPTEIRHVADRGASCTRPPLATSDYCEYVSRMPTPCKPLCLHVPADRNVAREDWRPLTESATPAMPTVILSPSGWCCCSRAYLHVRGFARAGKRHVLNSGRDTRMYRHPCGWCTNVFCKLEHVSVTLCPAPTRRASVTGECCLAAGLSVSSLWWTNDSRDRSHPAFLFTSLSFLGWASPTLSTFPCRTRTVLLLRDVSSPGVLEESRWGLETAVRCDRPGARFTNLWLGS